MKAHRLQPDAVVGGRYVVRRLLGQGSMGSVYLVEETATRTPRALKLMSPDLAEDTSFLARFAREAQVGKAIKSDHVVRVLATGVEPKHGLPWLVMEYLEGEDLARWLDARPPLDRAAAVAILAQLFDAVGAAHDAAVVHRDLRPDNVFVSTREGRPFLKVIDFGVAKVVREASLGATAPGLGAPLWAAPEQGARGGIKPSADVWSLGLLAFRLLGGAMFWKSAHVEGASPMDLAIELLRAPIPPASVRAREIGVADRLPAGFDAWFARAVVRDREQRFPNARAAWAALAPLFAPG
jgi:serine/threonine-protein kinase